MFQHAMDLFGIDRSNIPAYFVGQIVYAVIVNDKLDKVFWSDLSAVHHANAMQARWSIVKVQAMPVYSL